MRLAVFTLLIAAVLAGPIVAVAQTPAPTYDFPVAVEDVRVARERLRHWERIAERAGGTREEATLLLINGTWLRLEARRRGVDVTRAQVLRRFRREKRSSFASHRAFERFLRETGQTRTDILYRVRLELYSTRLRRYATGGAASPEEQQERLDAFVREFHEHWVPRTRCSPAYFVANSCAAE